jgi:hypothetical protein
VLLTDVAQVQDSVENLRNLGLSNGKPAVLLVLYRKSVPTSSTADRVKAIPPQFEASIPGAIKIDLAMDRTATIKASLHDLERTLVVAIGLVILVVFAFLKKCARYPDPERGSTSLADRRFRCKVRQLEEWARRARMLTEFERSGLGPQPALYVSLRERKVSRMGRGAAHDRRQDRVSMSSIKARLCRFGMPSESPIAISD